MIDQISTIFMPRAKPGKIYDTALILSENLSEALPNSQIVPEITGNGRHDRQVWQFAPKCYLCLKK